MLQLIEPDISSSVQILYIEEGINAGFPSPANDYLENRIDLNKEFVRNPSSTFYARVRGESMVGAGIDNNDLLIVDKSLDIKHGNIAVCIIDGEFTVKRVLFQKEEIILMPENKNFKPIKVNKEDEFLIWGVVTTVIKKIR
ncbi:MAG: LexA family protein [Bacteroidota bacterium]